MAAAAINLKLGTPIDSQTVVPGERFGIDLHAHTVEANNFNWTGYTPKGKIVVGTVSLEATGTVISAGGGTAEIIWTAAQTATLPTASWGSIIVYADPNTGSDNLHIATIFLRTTAEAIP